MKYIIAFILILIIGCKSSKKISIAEIKTDTVSTIYTKDVNRILTDSFFRAAAVDSYNTEEVIEYKTDSVSKITYPVRKTVKSKGVKTQVIAADKHTDDLSDFTAYIEAKKSADIYTKDKEVSRDSSLTRVIIAVVAIVIYLAIKMIRNGK